VLDICPTLPKPNPPCISEFKKYWRRTNPELAIGGKKAYGEYTAEALCKIWFVIQHSVGIDEDDSLGDWGLGWGKLLFSKQFMCPFPDLPAFGMELIPHVFARARNNFQLLGDFLKNTRIEEGNSVTIQNWEPMTIILQFDGPAGNNLNEEHLKIMRAIFMTPTVKCVLSTKLDKRTFEDYFTRTKEDVHILTGWNALKITGISTINNKYKLFLWLRKHHTPTTSWIRKYVHDFQQ
jgi:hypothetical protein